MNSLRAPRPTLRQVAMLAGLSVTTVSRVLNGEQYVSDEAVARVRTAAAQLGFRVNVLARELRSGAASTTVGLMIGDLANPFWSGVARGVEREIGSHGLRLLTASTDEDPALEWSLTQDMLDRRVRALLVVPSAADHGYLEAERRQGLAVVFIDRPPSNIVGDTVLLDNVGGARMATQHLLDGGHRRIAAIGDLGRFYTHQQRALGFREAMERAGIADWDRFLRAAAPDARTAEADTRELLALAEPPTALFTMNNWITAGALRALRAQPASTFVPALIGFDDIDLGDLLDVSVILHDPEEMGRIAARVALARVDHATGPMRTIVLPTTLVARGSGERPAPPS
jgi:LacI family transcriptional regulator